MSMDKNGKWITNKSYKEIIKLHRKLNNAKIPHTFEKLMDGYQVCYPVEDPEYRICDAIEHCGSYGHEIDRLELMGLLTPKELKRDSVVGHMTARRVFNRIKTDYDRRTING